MSRYVVSASGGTDYGAFFVPVAEHITNEWGLPVEARGISTGIVTAALWASDALDVHRAEYEAVTGPESFVKRRLDAWKGYYDLRPRLGARLRANGVGSRFVRPVSAGMIDVKNRQYRAVPLNRLPIADVHDAIIGSSTWPKPIMQRAYFRGRAVMDPGAGAHVLPPFSVRELVEHRATDWHLLIATPIGPARHDFPGAGDVDAFEELIAAFQLLMAGVLAADVAHARRTAATAGVHLHIWAPRSWDAIGPRPFVATPDLIQRRFTEAEAVIAERLSRPTQVH